MTSETRIRILGDDGAGHDRPLCGGPGADGSCPRAEIGAVVPCASSTIRRAGVDGSGYTVAPTATLCPVTLARSLDVGSAITLAG